MGGEQAVNEEVLLPPTAVFLGGRHTKDFIVTNRALLQSK